MLFASNATAQNDLPSKLEQFSSLLFGQVRPQDIQQRSEPYGNIDQYPVQITGCKNSADFFHKRVKAAQINRNINYLYASYITLSVANYVLLFIDLMFKVESATQASLINATNTSCLKNTSRLPTNTFGYSLGASISSGLGSIFWLLYQIKHLQHLAARCDTVSMLKKSFGWASSNVVDGSSFEYKIELAELAKIPPPLLSFILSSGILEQRENNLFAFQIPKTTVCQRLCIYSPYFLSFVEQAAKIAMLSFSWGTMKQQDYNFYYTSFLVAITSLALSFGMQTTALEISLQETLGQLTEKIVDGHASAHQREEV